MNKYQESLRALRALERYDNYERKKEMYPQTNSDILKELVSRATPKKPIITVVKLYNGNYEHCECVCGECLKFKDNFCSRCGQAIDWSNSD